METWGTNLISFLSGSGVGALGSYFATKYTDKRREKESIKKQKNAFTKVNKIMPDLINEMKTDFNNTEMNFVRELAVLPHNKVSFNSTQKRFVYFEDQHNDLKGKISILENHNYIYDVTPKNVPIYRITEEFFELVKKL